MANKTVKKIEATKPTLSAQYSTFTRKRKVAAYARVSTAKEEQENSFDAQVSYYTQKIQANPEWVFVEVYSDEGITGTNTKKRDGFNRMIEDALQMNPLMNSVGSNAEGKLNCINAVVITHKSTVILIELRWIFYCPKTA